MNFSYEKNPAYREKLSVHKRMATGMHKNDQKDVFNPDMKSLKHFVGSPSSQFSAAQF